MSKLFTIEGTNWRVARDKYGNYQPEEHREVKKKGGSVEMEWIKHKDFHPNLGAALEDIIDKELYSGMPVDGSIITALELYKQIVVKITECCTKSKGWV